MKQAQWKSSIGVLTSCGALFCASVPAQAIDLGRPPLFVLVADKTHSQKCITIDGHEICIGKKQSGTPAGDAEGAPPINDAGQGGGNPGGAGGGNATPPADDAGAPPPDNAGAPPADAADTALEPGEHRCPVGYLVLETQNKFGAFCEAVEGFKAAPGTESIERACPAGYVVLDKPNKYHALCEPKEGFPAAPAN